MDKARNYFIVLFLAAQAGFNYSNNHLFTFWLLAFTMVILGCLLFELKSVFEKKKDTADYRQMYLDVNKIHQQDKQELQAQIELYKNITLKTAGQLTQKEYDHARQLYLEEQKSKNKKNGKADNY